ncbi:MAG TPA: hypothetical protein VFA76_16660 [Terriglobales bacterium]|nr:hypothetical protein [Terriglobales bacterium]
MRLVIAVLMLIGLAISAKVPDLPQGASLYLQNQSKSDEAGRFEFLLRNALTKADGDSAKKSRWGAKHYFRSGLNIVPQKEKAQYVLSFYVIHREHTAQTLGDAVLQNTNGDQLWSAEYHCGELDTVAMCVGWLSDDVKGAQVNPEGKRAGLLGWKLK